jgi:hypothetical protein
MGFLAGPNPLGAQQLLGAYGQSDQLGVFGFAMSAQGIGVHGNSAAGAGTGVWGHTSFGVGVLGTSNASGKAARFEGIVEIVRGTSQAVGLTIGDRGDVVLGDCAEDFQLASDLPETAPGSVMVLDGTGAIRPCSEPYDKCAVGVVSGAGSYRPAIVFDRTEASKERLPISLVGKVCCMVDATFGAIEIGDMLTTSSTVGHAMKAADPTKAFGAVIGKALGRLAEGRGLIPILAALQ